MPHAPEILFVEDNIGDVTLLSHAFTECWPGVIMRTVSTVDRALAYLKQLDPYQAAVVPSLILLDLNLPGGHGHGLLAALSQGKGPKSVPIVVFSSSCRPKEIAECYRLGASMYVMKPDSYDGYHDLANSFAKMAALNFRQGSLQGA